MCILFPSEGTSLEHLHYDVRYLFRALDEEFTVSHESHALEWVPHALLESRTQDISVLRLRDKWQARNGAA